MCIYIYIYMGLHRDDMSQSLNFLTGVIWGIFLGATIEVIKGDTRSLDDGSDDQHHAMDGPLRSFERMHALKHCHV